MRLATLITTSGPRLHVRADDGGYVDIGEATGEDRFARFESFIAAGPAAVETARGLLDREGRDPFDLLDALTQGSSGVD